MRHWTVAFSCAFFHIRSIWCCSQTSPNSFRYLLSIKSTNLLKEWRVCDIKNYFWLIPQAPWWGEKGTRPREAAWGGHMNAVGMKTHQRWPSCGDFSPQRKNRKKGACPSRATCCQRSPGTEGRENWSEDRNWSKLEGRSRSVGVKWCQCVGIWCKKFPKGDDDRFLRCYAASGSHIGTCK